MTGSFSPRLSYLCNAPLDTYLFLLKACLEESVVKRVTEVELVLVN